MCAISDSGADEDILDREAARRIPAVLDDFWYRSLKHWGNAT